jgi:hypothetical protein
MNRAAYYDYIELQLSTLATRLEVRAKDNILDLHIHAENFYRKFLGALFDYELTNANIETKNAPGIDLVDNNNKIVIQVSAQATKAKIENSLRRIPARYEGYRFLFISIAKDATNLRTKVYKEIPQDIKFDPALDIHDIPSLLSAINALIEIEDVAEIDSLFRSEFSNERKHNSFDIKDYAAGWLERGSLNNVKKPFLLAEHRELDTYVDFNGVGASEAIRVVDIPEQSSLCYLLGESGSGKTTSLWKIFNQTCTNIVAGDNSTLPLYIDLKRWSNGESLIMLAKPSQYDAKSFNLAARNQKCLFLIDGLNEVQKGVSQSCFTELAHFIGENSTHKFIIACRTSDFNPRLIPLSDTNYFANKIDSYEISRLSKNQIVEYSKEYLKSTSVEANDFLGRLQIDNQQAWLMASSSLQLARIPLFLQVFLESYVATLALPDSRAGLLRSLISLILDRERSKSSESLTPLFVDRAFGDLATQLSAEHYSLRFPLIRAREILSSIFSDLKSSGAINGDTTFDGLWRQTLSANILRENIDSTADWLHQLIRDYFLGCNIALNWSTHSASKKIKLYGLERSRVRGNDISIGIALDILGNSIQGASFLWSLLDSGDVTAMERAKVAFEAQSSSIRYGQCRQIIQSIVDDGDYETELLNEFAVNFPFFENVDSFYDAYLTTSNEQMKPLIVDAISSIIIKYLPRLENRDQFGSSLYFGFHAKKARMLEFQRALKKSDEVLKRILNGSNEWASLSSVKGLWESDRSACIERLKALTQSNDSSLRKEVEFLIDDWGIR